jgi:hypothetical protein
VNDDAQSGFDYAALVRAALVGMVRGVLAQVAAEGLPAGNHFYLTFGTTEPGVVLPPRLKKQFPEEMTIVLQHQFWNLAVEEKRFSVTLRFGGSSERLTVPWDALRAFADPSVGFGVRLKEAGSEPPASEVAPPGSLPVPASSEEAAKSASPDAGPKVVDFGAFRRRADGETEA